MRKLALAICAIVTVAGVLYAGYRLAWPGPASAAQTDATNDWPSSAVRIAVAVVDYPLFYATGDTYAGFFADLLEQAPLRGQQWVATTLAQGDAIAAVNARSVDLALVAEPRGQRNDDLEASPPLLTGSVSLLSADPVPPIDGYAGKEVAWFGPDGVAGLVLRLSATPVSVLSADDCVRSAASRQAAACAIDENLGSASASQLGLQGLYVTGEALGSVEYRLVWAPADARVAAAVQSWLATLEETGALSALERKWLGTPVVESSSPGFPTTVAAALGVLCGLAVLTSVGFAARYRSLRRTIRSRQIDWRDADARYHGLLDVTNDAVFVLDQDQSTIVEANGRAEELTGYTRAELLQTRFHQLVPARQRRLLREWFLDGADGGRAEEMPLVRRDGSVATVEMRSRITEDGSQTVRLCLVRETTQQKSMQREVARVTELTDRLLEGTTNGVATVDADCLVTSCNRALLQAIGYDGDAVGQALASVLRTEGQPVSVSVQSALTEGTTQRGQVSLIAAGGRPVPSSVIVSPLRDEQAISGAVLVFTDMSQESKAREEWQRLGMLSALGQVSGVLAHDIRNRVTSVQVGVQYLAGKFPPEDPRRQSLEFIRTETDRAVQIIDDILMLIRPGRVDKTPCRISDIVEGVVRSQAAYAYTRGVNVAATLTQETLLVRADAVQLERALSNLVKNAIEAMPQGGTVRMAADLTSHAVEGREREAPLRLSARAVRIRVSDDGPGIPPGIRAKLFQPFASEKEGGTGLGLSITKRIVDDHGGSIEVESREGRGTTFTVLLPAISERET